MKHIYTIAFCIFIFLFGSVVSSAQVADLGILGLNVPVSPLCASKKPLIVTIHNYGPFTHNFSQDRASIVVNVSGASVQSFTLNINSGSLSPSTFDQYLVTPQVDLTAAGIHHFDISIDILTGDADSSNNILPTEDILVNPLPIVSLDTFPALCFNTPSVILSEGSPIGGTYSGVGVSSGMFDPAIAGVGTTTITYTYTDTNGCTSATAENILVHGIPVVMHSSLPDVCIATATFTLTGGSPFGGTYNGPGVNAGTFDPATSGIGTFSINYTYTDTNGCSDSLLVTQTVYTAPTVVFSSLPSVCSNTPAFTLNTGSPSGGTYSGTAVAANTFDASVSGIGTFSLTYVYSDASGCTDSAMQTILVNNLPVVTHSSLNNICESAGITLLSGGSPAGGTYSGTGASDTLYNPALAGPGTFTLTYTYTDSAGCSDTALTTISVIASPTVTLSSFSPVCTNGSPFVLNGGSPAGGTYSGNGVNSGIFDPASTTAGTHLISYLYIDTATTCRDTATQSIVVNPLPSLHLNDTIFCGTILTLSAGNPGASYLWSTGATTQTILLTSNDTVHVTVTTTNNCIASDTAIASFFPAPVLMLGEDITTCEDNIVQLNACAANWNVYTWCTGDTTCIITALNSGIYCLVTTDNNGCTATDSINIIINPLPAVSFSLSTTFFCLNDPVNTLMGGSPAGGTYSGNGVSGGLFNPSIAGAGNHLITYTFTDTSTGCSDTATKTVTVGCTGIVSTEIESNFFTLYPNPSNDVLNIVSDKDINNLALIITDIQGKILYADFFSAIKKGDIQNINTTLLADGLYFVQWKTAADAVTRKFIVRH